MVSAGASPTLDSDPFIGRLPVTVITGCLGSGKSTLLRRLVRQPGMERTAVIINEFGEVALDHELVAASTEQTILLSNGCLCCTVRTDLQWTLRELFIDRRAGRVVDFNRVLIETTGLADPIPVMQAIQADAVLAEQYRLDGIVTLVDAVNAPSQLDRLPEASKQIALADRIVLTKIDLVDDACHGVLVDSVRRINSFASICVAVDGNIDPGFLGSISPRCRADRERTIAHWLDRLPEDTPVPVASVTDLTIPRRAPSMDAECRSHNESIRSFCLWFDAPFTPGSLNGALQLLTTLRGEDLLRVKGIVNVIGERGPVLIQGAQHVFHPLVTMDHWYSEERRSRIVFIVRRIEREAIELAFRAARNLDATP